MIHFVLPDYNEWNAIFFLYNLQVLTFIKTRYTLFLTCFTKTLDVFLHAEVFNEVSIVTYIKVT